MSRVEIIREGPGFTEARIDMSQPKQRVVRVGDKSLREPSMHTLGDQLNYTDAGQQKWGRDLIILPVPMDLFDVEVYEKTRIRLIPKTSLAASLMSDWLGSDVKMVMRGVNAQCTGSDDTLCVEITFEPRKQPEPVVSAPPSKKPKKGGGKLRRQRRSPGASE